MVIDSPYLMGHACSIAEYQVNELPYSRKRSQRRKANGKLTRFRGVDNESSQLLSHDNSLTSRVEQKAQKRKGAPT